MISCLLAASLPLWFCADFDSPTEFEGKRIELVIPAGKKVEGKFGNGYAFVSPQKRAENLVLRLNDYEMLKSFPSKDGAFACWFKTADTNAPVGAAFSLGSFWSFRWGWVRDGFQVGPNARKQTLKFKKPIGKSTAWRHFVATWNEKALRAYLDGEEILCKENQSLEPLEIKPGDVLRFGSGTEGSPYACGYVMDDMAIFARSLTAEEVKDLSSGKKPLRTKKKDLEYYDYFKGVPRPASMDDTMIFSWGGHKNSTLEFLKKIGINTVCVSSMNTARARKVAQAGFAVNIRYENSPEWKRIWGKEGPQDVMDRTEAALSPYRTLKAWRSTLVNSEVYNGRIIFRASSNELWKAWAKKVNGGEVDFTMETPLRLDYKTLGIKPYQGILPDDNPTLNTLFWFGEKGHPVYYVNELNRRVIKKLNPDNVVWSEPSPSAIGLDMIADWMYDYSIYGMLQEYIFCYGEARSKNTKFMPTFGGSYCGNPSPAGKHATKLDKDGKPKKIAIAPSVDDMKIRCWMAIASTPVDAISFWDDGAWCHGAENAKKLLEDPNAYVSHVAEIDFADRFGEFMHKEFIPALKKFKGVPNVTAPVAILKAPEAHFAGTERWTYYKYPRLLARTLSALGVTYDVLYNDEITAKNLSKYKYVILPMGFALTKAHYDALSAASKTTTIVTDSYCKFTFEKQEPLVMKFVDHHGLKNPKRLLTTEPITEWAKKNMDEIRKASVAWTDRDGIDAFTFVKQLPNGRKAVIVINDARENRSLWPNLCTAEWYRSIAAKNTITLHINTPKGEIVKTYDFKPAEAKVFEVPEE